MEEKQNELYIPSNIKTRLEFFKGYGIKEMVITGMVMIFSLPIVLALYKLKGTLIAIICLFIVVSATVIVKDDNNLCVSKQIGFMFKNINMQKKYRYKYFDKRREIK